MAGGGVASYTGASDRSVPIAVGVGARSGVADRSRTPVVSAETWKCPVTAAACLRPPECKEQLYPEATHAV